MMRLRFLRLPRYLPWQSPNKLFHRAKKFSTKIRSCDRSRLCSFCSSVNS
jgi:hypothetical protein